ncbi:MAG TPA: endonuclease/exonuclease/phosphatase family protein, partial [Armatimonadota bacterium]|nr:endonuclease/exonuclease/phosphatase family protein [Armatimonadota bacterium]
MKILTYNIAGNKGLRRPDHLQRIAELILQSNADVVGLQEVAHRHGARKDPEQLLCELTGMHAEYLPAHRHRDHELGNVVLCRQPIARAVSHELPHTWPERRVLLEVETNSSDGLPITVFCTHLVHLAQAGRRIRLVQATAVAKWMSACARPHVLVGDLNASPQASELHPVRKVCVRGDHLTGLRSW